MTSPVELKELPDNVTAHEALSIMIENNLQCVIEKEKLEQLQELIKQYDKARPN